MERHDEVLDESDAVTTAAGMAVARVAETFIRFAQQQEWERTQIAERLRKENEARYEADARTAEAYLRQVTTPAWLDSAEPTAIGQAWRAADQWAEVDRDRFGQYARTMNDECRQRWGMDLEDIKTRLGSAELTAIFATGAVMTAREAAAVERERDDDQAARTSSQGRDEERTLPDRDTAPDSEQAIAEGIAQLESAVNEQDALTAQRAATQERYDEFGHGPATDRQLAYLRSFGVDKKDLSVKEASEMLTQFELEESARPGAKARRLAALQQAGVHASSSPSPIAAESGSVVQAVRVVGPTTPSVTPAVSKIQRTGPSRG